MNKLNIIWSTDNKEVFFNLVAMYSLNGIKEKWWDNIRLIIWGPSAKLVAMDSQVKTEIKELLFTGVDVIACKECADNYQVSPQLENLGIEVFFTGELLTNIIKKDEKLITF